MTRHLATFISTDYRDGAFPPIVPAPGLVPPLFAYGDYTQAPLAGGIRLYLKPALYRGKPTPYQSLRRPVDNHIVTDSPAGCLPAHVVPFSGFGLSPRSPCCYLLYASQAGVGMGWFPPFSKKKAGRVPATRCVAPLSIGKEELDGLTFFSPPISLKK